MLGTYNQWTPCSLARDDDTTISICNLEYIMQINTV